MRAEKFDIGQITITEGLLEENFMLSGEMLQCGECLEVLVCNGLNGGSPEWIETRFEIDGSGSGYLVGLIGYQVSGLFARRL